MQLANLKKVVVLVKHLRGRHSFAIAGCSIQQCDVGHSSIVAPFIFLTVVASPYSGDFPLIVFRNSAHGRERSSGQNTDETGNCELKYCTAENANMYYELWTGTFLRSCPSILQ